MPVCNVTMHTLNLPQRLRLIATAGAQAQDWNAVGPPDPSPDVPSGDQAAQILRKRFKVAQSDATAAAQARPDPGEDPELWWVLERCYKQIVTGMGSPDMIKWPPFPAEKWGLKGRFVYIYALLSALPRTMEYFTQRGIPESMINETFADLAEKLRLDRDRVALPGLGKSLWFTLHFKGALYQLGRLQFAMESLREELATGDHKPDELTLGMHIRAEGGGLDPVEVVDSVARADEFFTTHFPELYDAPPLYTCTSWLLDPQLREFLRPDSNIARFQDMFELLPAAADAGTEGNRNVLLFVFNIEGSYNPATLPRNTTLEKHLADGLAQGRQWQMRTGFLSKDSNSFKAASLRR